jgi:hypothetical protein
MCIVLQEPRKTANVPSHALHNENVEQNIYHRTNPVYTEESMSLRIQSLAATEYTLIHIDGLDRRRSHHQRYE